MERWNWALLGLMGLVTALGLTTSSGTGKAKTVPVDGDFEVVACAPLTATVSTSDAAPIELAASVPATSHAGCSACQAKKAAATNNTAMPEPSAKAFGELVAMIHSIKPTTGNVVASEACPGNCLSAGVCCDKSLSKSDTGHVVISGTPACQKTVAATPNLVSSSAAIPNPGAIGVCEGACPLSKKEDVANLDQSLVPRSGLVELYQPAGDTTDCPLAKAANAIANLTKNYVCEGGECKPLDGITVAGKTWTLTPECCFSKDHGTLTITAVDPAAKPDGTAKPQGLLNLIAAGEVVARKDETPKTITTKNQNGTVTSTITINSDDLTKAGTGTLTLNVKATDQAPAVAIVQETKTSEAKPAVDNSRAAARAAKLAKLEEKLSQASFLKSEETKLADIAELIEAKTEIPVILDQKAMEEAAFDTATPIYIGAHPEMELGDHLQGILKNVNLTWLIPATNDRVLITTMTAAESTHLNRVYDVSDLVGSGFSDADELITRIESLVAPITWKSNGGRGDISAWQQNSRAALIVSNTFATHRELTNLLEDLRLVSANQAKGADKRLSAKQEPLLQRYTLQSFDPSVAVEDRAKIRKAQSETFLALFKEIPEFDPDSLQVIELDHQLILVTKQSPKVHAQILEYFKILEWDPRKHGGVLGANF